MNVLKAILNWFGTDEVMVPILKVPFGGPRPMDDRQLSKHFTLWDLTHTDHSTLQEKNRIVTEAQIEKLGKVAALVEAVWDLLEVPLTISSAYRCPDLNKAVGSTDRSQHLLAEASDMVPMGMEVPEAFKKLWKAGKDGRIKYGQLIYEKAPRGYAGGVVEWIHISLGEPYRVGSRCGQVLTMVDGTYTVVDTVE